MGDRPQAVPDTVRSGLRVARSAWPEVVVTDEVFAAYVAERAGEGGDLGKVDWPELYLACACGRGDVHALRAFDQHYLREVPAAVAHVGLARSDVDEIVQEIREKLFVSSPGEPPRIDTYAGGGSLHGLVRVMAVRAAISMTRRHKRETRDPEDELLRLPSVAADPELDSAKRELRDHFAAAFERAVTELTPRERNLLRMHLLDGVTLDQLATSYGVHRVTVTRWLVKARRALLVATRRQLEARVGGPVGDLDSFVGLVKSRLELSFRRLLGSQSAAS